MLKIEKTVFISYRRTNVFIARAIYDNLTKNGFDVFFDYESIRAGDFEQIIFKSIESRAHFLLILTPSTLLRCKEPNDMVKREIEHAVKHKRNIVPLTFEGFDFKDIETYLPTHLQILSKYNALNIPVDYFEEAMTRLRNLYLHIPIEAILHPAPEPVERYEVKQKAKISTSPKVTAQELISDVKKVDIQTPPKKVETAPVSKPQPKPAQSKVVTRSDDEETGELIQTIFIITLGVCIIFFFSGLLGGTFDAGLFFTVLSAGIGIGIIILLMVYGKPPG